MRIKEIPGCPNYAINEAGEVFNLKLNRKLTGSIRNNRRRCVSIKGQVFHVHQLVAELFLENPFGFYWVIHKDGDTLNNHVSNLAWVPTHLYRNSYEPQPVVAQDETGEVVIRYESLYQVGQGGFCHQSVQQCLEGTLKTHAGLRWRYESASA